MPSIKTYFKNLLADKGYLLPSLAVLGAIVVAVALFLTLTGGSEGLDVDRLVRERRALVAEASAGVTIIETAPSRLARVDVVPSVIAVSPGQTTLITALAYDQQAASWTTYLSGSGSWTRPPGPSAAQASLPQACPPARIKTLSLWRAPTAPPAPSLRAGPRWPSSRLNLIGPLPPLEFFLLPSR
jgi:hypothetical protein